MAKLKFSGLLGEQYPLDWYYQDAQSIRLESKSTTKVTYVDSDGDQIVFIGTHLKVNSQHELTVGTVNEIDFNNPDGSAYAKLIHANLDAGDLYDTTVQFGVDATVGTALAGRDTVIGSGIGDVMSGGGGNDTLTGNGGHDRFMFGRYDGKDVITDFNANDESPDHDVIWATTPFFSVKQDHDNTVIDFHGGATLTLLHVNAHTIGDSDLILL